MGLIEHFCTELKAAIAKQTDIPAANQRLIFSGKHLHPDNKVLSDFNIVHESSIHLFPRPVSAAPPPEDSSPGRQRILRITRLDQGGPLREYDVGVGDATGLHRTVPEVRLWCYILFFYSFMTLFSHLSFVANTGEVIFQQRCIEHDK